MAIQNGQTILKLADSDPKSLVHGPLPETVQSVGLTEGVDYIVDYTYRTVRRLREFGRELITFSYQYEDYAEQRAAEEARRQLVATQQATVQLQWAAHALKGKTPAEIYTLAQDEINSWTTLAQAKAGLATWLPFMLAGLAWMVLENR